MPKAFQEKIYIYSLGEFFTPCKAENKLCTLDSRTASSFTQTRCSNKMKQWLIPLKAAYIKPSLNTTPGKECQQSNTTNELQRKWFMLWNQLEGAGGLRGCS